MVASLAHTRRAKVRFDRTRPMVTASTTYSLFWRVLKLSSSTVILAAVAVVLVSVCCVVLSRDLSCSGVEEAQRAD